MEFEWDDKKSALVKATRGASFEELESAIAAGDLIATEIPPHSPQRFLVVRFKGEAWVVVVEDRGEKIRIVTAYASRKMRKKYGI